MGAQDNTPKPPSDKRNTVDDAEVRKESSKAAQSALELKKQANELKQAAAGAGDPQERQKLMEQAIDKEIKAESFGKTAKYLRSGTFQGLVAGTGIGVVPGMTLGTLTGTLVGGVTSLITGGLGAAGGAVVGALHGPFFNLGEMAGKGIQKVTGNLPGWKATPEQKRTLEKMCGQIKDEEMPDEVELERLKKDGGATSGESGGLMENVKSMAPDVPGWGKAKQAETRRDHGAQAVKDEPKPRAAKRTRFAASEANDQGPTAEVQPQSSANRQKSQQEEPKKPRKLEARSEKSKPQTTKPSGEQRKPRKLEVRS